MRARAATVLATAVMVLGATAGPAGADQAVLHDASRDVWRLGFVDDGSASKAPDVRVGDVRRMAVRHGRTRVVVRLKFRDLRRTGRYAGYEVRLQNRAGLHREVVVGTSRRTWRGKVAVFDQRSEKVRCAVTHRIDYARNTVSVTVPRTCVGSPDRVRAAAVVSWIPSSREEILTDNPHHERARVGERTWSRWVRRG